jgi:heterodisulfide reductase subunit B
MKYALFLGCTVPIRNMNYELSTRKVAEKLGIEFVDSNDFACCGFPLKGMDQHTALLMAARNLATAEAMELDICALCTACSVTLTEANKQLCDNAELRAQVNQELVAAGGKAYQGTIKVRHIARALYEGVGVAGLESAVKTKLSGFKFAAQYGCHYMKPSEVFEGFEDPENPKTLDALIQATGAEAVDYATKLECCGGGILAADEQIALAMPYTKLSELKKLGADAMVLVCPFCDVMYEYNQRRIEKAFSATLQMPVLFYPQVLGLALGIPAEELGFKLNRVKTKELNQKLAALET